MTVQTVVLNLPISPPPGESVFDGKFYWPVSLWNETHPDKRIERIEPIIDGGL